MQSSRSAQLAGGFFWIGIPAGREGPTMVTQASNHAKKKAGEGGDNQKDKIDTMHV
jgi:hypothetical protein